MSERHIPIILLMLFYFFSNSCHNISGKTDPHLTRYRQQVWYLLCTLLPICLSAVIANSLSFWIFWHQSFDNKGIRFNLLSISMAEICTQMFIIFESTLVFLGLDDVNFRWSILLKTLIHWGINSFICIRNWTVLLLTVSRCEVVNNPLSVRNKMVFSHHRSIILELVFVFLSLSLSFLNNVRYMMKICSNLGGLVTGERLLVKYTVFVYFQFYGIFMFQSLIPVVITTSATIIIWVSLHHASSFNRGPKIEIQKHRHPSHSVRATTTILVLVFSIVFCILQIPTFIATCITTFRSSHDYTIHPDIFANAFCIIGSLSNFFAYAASSKRFRLSLKGMFIGSDRPQFSDQYYNNLTVASNDKFRKLSDRSVML